MAHRNRTVIQNAMPPAKPADLPQYSSQSASLMPSTHRNKTFTTLLAAIVGGLGLHRFYLHGAKDQWGWLHLSSALLSLSINSIGANQPEIFVWAPLIVSILAGFIEALVLGLMPDDKWDAQHNRNSGRSSNSSWPLALILVLTLGIGATALIAVIARTSDLLLTGGAYG
jgi:hypothetical protein